MVHIKKKNIFKKIERPQRQHCMDHAVIAHPLLECLHLKTHFFTNQPTPLLTIPTVSKHFFLLLKSVSSQFPLSSPILAITISYQSFIIMRGKLKLKSVCLKLNIHLPGKSRRLKRIYPYLDSFLLQRVARWSKNTRS